MDFITGLKFQFILESCEGNTGHWESFLAPDVHDTTELQQPERGAVL